MKNFVKNIPLRIIGTFTVMMMCFIIITYLRGIEMIPIARLVELFILSVIGGIWMEFTFGTYVFNKMPDVIKTCIFIVPFAIATFIFAVIFQWITELKLPCTYIKFIGMFVVCWIISIILFEIEHIIRGKKYTEKLREYQNGQQSNE